MKLTLNIESNNAAFTDEDEPNDLHLAELLDEQLVSKVRDGHRIGTFRDPISGQTVGMWELAPGVTE
jgi:hypothetical protein